jgi:hypothetical protein
MEIFARVALFILLGAILASIIARDWLPIIVSVIAVFILFGIFEEIDRMEKRHQDPPPKGKRK